MIGRLEPLYAKDIQLVAWRRYRHKELVGHAWILLLPAGLNIRGVRVFKDGARRWARLPANAPLGDDELRRDPATGAVGRAQIVSWRTTTGRDLFSTRVVELVGAHDPSAFGSEP